MRLRCNRLWLLFLLVLAPEQARAIDRTLENAKLKQEDERATPVVVDSDTMAKLMNQAQKLRKDGYLEWDKGATRLPKNGCCYL